jgi:hypothetical protein
MATKNRWQSFDGTEPVLQWTLSVPAPQAAERRAVVDEVMAAGRSSGVLVAGEQAVRSEGELLPWAEAIVAGASVPFSSTVFVRDAQGAVVRRSAGDAGALLRSLEPLELAYARRFAASHPFAAAWSTCTATSVAVHVAFFTSLWFDATDAELTRANEPQLAVFRAALVGIARRRGGRLVAPSSPSPST